MTLNQIVQLANQYQCNRHENPYTFGFFIKNRKETKQLNIYFNKYRKDVSVTLFDGTKSGREQYKSVFDNNYITKEILDKLIQEYLYK
jgi:hypothetical protein